ncbi:prepilin-type N-terminal cleavage/methylation domain-containing protein [Lederbergia wuyishanensis]|uniref:Prepilin-type N-terminal cleavage/methylation domain-containing protein n=1 Tax=Lederbergia wuyishanensis TaxID=1347903 RepID=A0ABU0D1U6_9BACI|nr:prepilin-type N-terminal cleavage/methylation domain-containing protein [Lederbergia wuyishanensis]MCJ8006997.1 prepilin-type N-terminal cleavage/methylation domain-containing protein [Lederbergia wuyishanensis]MDQ0342381.1 prepilin-type N-terminal cleavage/methylation domain-containing protein [Lederbergia wuyishanensis]
MIKKYLSQQQGITLLELLTALAIFSLIIGLTFSVLFSSKKFNDKTQAHINLRQEANIIITNIRKHQQNTEKVCYEQLLTNEKLIMEMQIDGVNFKNGDCWIPTDSKDIHVEFTLTDKIDHYNFAIDTIIEGKKRKEFSITMPDSPVKDETFFEYLKNNNIFVHGTDLGFTGSTKVTTENNSGTIVINNLNNSNLVFDSNTEISVKRIYINKQGNDVFIQNSTVLGDLNKTELVRIVGNVHLSSGSPKIYGGTIFIDGSVTFDSNAEIKGKKIIITGDVSLQKGTDISGDEIYIGGTVTSKHNDNIEGKFKDFNLLSEDDIPKDIYTISPTFRQDSWYPDNNYEIRSFGSILNNSKIFSQGNCTLDGTNSNKQNVIIISKGDITVKNFEGSELTGILFAPNGKVTFNGKAFKGVVIARDGFFIGNSSTVTFTNVNEFIKNPELVPFQ